MPTGKSAAVVMGSFPLGESDLLVTFFSRQHGTLRGVARRARRLRSRLGGALEMFTLGDLVFFDGGRSELVQVDHFDVARPFARLREDLERLGQAAWIVECVGRLTGERDAHPALFSLLVRALTAIDAGEPPARLALAFGLRCVDALGHRLRLDGCVSCGRRLRGAEGRLALDLEAGGLVCGDCERVFPAARPLAPATLSAWRRLRVCAWSEAASLPLGGLEAELRAIVDDHVARLIGHPPRTTRFLREVTKLTHMPGGSR